MAKKTRTKKAAAKPKATEPVKSKDLMKMPPEATVRAVAKDIAATKLDVGNLNEELSEVVAAAKKDKGVHPGALKRVVGLITKARKTDRGLAAVSTELAHFDYYCDVLGLSKMLEEQGQMFARTETGEKEPPIPDAKLPLAPARETEEEAGAATTH
jgi:hypothetical protein